MFEMFRKPIFVVLIVCSMMAVLVANKVDATEKGRQEDYRNAISAARENVWKAITSGKGSGASVAIMDQGQLVYSEGFGTANRSENRPVDKNTRFNIGSTSKMFAAVAILQLVDEGKVALDESVTKYIPEFKMKDERCKKITVRMLFNHSSGLPGSSFYFGYKPDSRTHKVLLDVLKDSHLKHDPGAMSIYCNDGFTLAEIIVEKVSGKKFMDFLSERVFAPLGMKHTSVSVGEIGSDANIAEYYNPKTGKKYPREVLAVYAAGGLSSTAEDLCRFGDGLSGKGKRILSDASLRELLKAQPVRFSDTLRDPQLLGQFGWEYSNLDDYQKKGIQVLGKGGNTGFYSANLQIVPEKRIAIGIAISGQVAGEALTRPILDALMKDKKLLEQKAKAAAERPLQPMPIPRDLLGYAGYYVNETDVVKVSFNEKKKTFTISPLDRKKTVNEKLKSPLTFIYNDGCFHNSEEGLSCYFTHAGDNVFIVLHKMPVYGLDALFFQKIDRITKPVRLKSRMDGKVWLLRNVPPFVVVTGPDLIVVSSLYKQLPGYVGFAGIKKIEKADFAGMAATAFRDQSELALFSQDGVSWAKTGCFLFSSADATQKLSPGITSVRIGKNNYNEWRRLEKGALLSFEKPQEGRVIVLTQEAVLFDSVVDSGEVYAPAGSYVFLAGVAVDLFKIHAR